MAAFNGVQSSMGGDVNLPIWVEIKKGETETWRQNVIFIP